MAKALVDAVSYRRLSPRPDGAYELGLERQDEEIKRVAKYRQLRVVREFIDEDRSAFRGKRPGYEAMMAAVRAKEVEAVVAYDIDRLYRRPRELEDLIDLAEQGVLVVTAQGDIDLTNSNGRAMARVVVAMASKSSEDESRRMKLKHAQLAKHGKVAGGKRPFGYRADRVSIDKREAKLIREAVDHVLGGGSLRSIITDWNARGIKTANGAEWKHFTLKHVLTSPRVAGLRAHKGQVVGQAEWDAIITETEHTKLKAILNDPQRRPRNMGAGRKYLLTGLATCSLCGAKLVARPRGGGERSMVCASDQGGCGKIRTLAEPLEEHVAAMIAVAIDDQGLIAAIEADADQGDAGELVQAIEEDESRLEELAAAHFAERLIGRGEYQAAKAILDARLDENRGRLAAATTRSSSAATLPASGDALLAMWDDLDVARRRAIVEILLADVTLAPAVKGRNFFDPGRVSVKWRV